MPFNRPTVDTIYSRIKADMETRLTGDVKIARFSVLGVVAKVFAGTIHLCYGVLVWLADQLFPDTAEQDYLDRQAQLKGLARKAASFADGKILMTGVNSTNIPAGTIWQDSNGTQYITDVLAIISSGSAEVNVTSATSGSNANTSDAILSIVNPLASIDSEASVTETIGGGANEETDAELRERLLALYKEPLAGGRAADYTQWSLEVPGVGDAWVFDAFSGPSTVGVAISDGDGNIVDAGVKTNCQDNIDANRPLGVVATVYDIAPVEITLDVDVNPNNGTIQTNINNNLTSLFATSASPGGNILLSQIRTAIGTSTVIDYEITEIYIDGSPNGVQDIELTGFQYANFGSVVYGDLA